MEDKIARNDWFAVQVKPRHEKTVYTAFGQRGLEPFLPLYLSRRRWSDRMQEVQLPLFPGYVFCKFNQYKRVPVLSTPGVFGIVGFGRELAVVDSEEISALQRLMQSGIPTEPYPHVEIGQSVEIEDGPLAGCQGRVVEIKKQPRLVLSVTLLRRSVLVELDREWVKSLTPRPLAILARQEKALQLQKSSPNSSKN